MTHGLKCKFVISDDPGEICTFHWKRTGGK